MNRAGMRQEDGRHVLVVEDEPQLRSMLTDNLEFEGYKVTAVASGEEGLAALSQQAFALVLLDVMLPGMSGFDVCQTVRARGTRVPIIVLTARAQERDRVKGLDLGADDYVSKPFSVRELMARVRAQVRRPAFRGIAALDVRFLPYSALEQHRDAMARFGEGLKAIQSIAQPICEQ